jgi:DNA-binding ferritin-like protein
MEAEQIVHEAEAHPTLSHHEQREVGLELQATLVELVGLALLGKQLCWSVVGPGFRPLHLQLDELVDAWRELAHRLAAAPSGAVADRDVVELLACARNRTAAAWERQGFFRAVGLAGPHLGA